MKPMLAADCEGNTKLIRFPVMASPKLDGIRAITTGDMVVTRSLKPVRNQFIQEKLRGLPPGLDGELIVGPSNHKDVFRRSTSGVSSAKGEPDFTFWVFDKQPNGGHNAPFSVRYAWLTGNLPKTKYVKLLEHKLIKTEELLLCYEEACLELGWEGVMVRLPEGQYKQGRATLNEGWLTKVKRFCDAEGIVIGYKELLHNENVATINALGHTERSSRKAGKRGGSMLGAMTLRSNGVQFDLGTGFTEKERRDLWAMGDGLLGRVVKYRYFPTGSKDKPRFPTWAGFRAEEDM